MADKLIFPIGFDLESAVKKAEGDAEKVLRRLSVAIQSKPLALNLKINGAGDGSINSINSRIRELVKQWDSLTEAQRITNRTTGEYSAEAKRILKEYTKLIGASESYARTLQQISATARRNANEQERNVAKQRATWAKLHKAISANENTIDGLNAKIKAYQQRLNGLEVGSKKFEKTAEKIRNLTLKLDEAKRKMAELTGGINKTSNAFNQQDGYVSRLIKRLVVYAGYQQIANFLKGVKEVTAQFELQRVSLGAILQDQTKANALFSEIKQFALKSPVSILDLTKYTKQLAAYKIGYDELFETTKRLTDVSVGLSVSLDRVILAYGQVRARGALYSSEIRQFTEMGVPIVEELAAKLTKMNGELVTSAQVLKLVEKGAISFDLVKEVFDDMTSAGGMFYNMQEKQGNTLFGLWAKLGDAASVMYDEIGNTDDVNEGMKSAIEGLTELMRNWRSWAKTAATMGGIFSVTAASVYVYTTALKANTIAKKANTAESIAARTENIKGNVVLRLTNSLLQKCGVSANKATAYTVAFSKAFRLIGAVSFGAVIAGVTWLVEKCFEAYENAHRLSNALKEIETESGIEQMKSVRNFEALANMAIQAADGSKKQKDALDELLRTYKDIIPQERLTIENLRAMKGNYDSLTESIRTYVAEQMKQKQINSVLEITGKAMIEKTREIQDIMKDTWNYEQIARFMSAYEQIIRDNPAIRSAEAMKKAAEDTGVGWQKMLNLGVITRDQLAAALRSYASSLKEQITQVDALDAAWNNNYMALGKYGKEYENLVNKVKENPIEMGGSTEIDESKTPYFYKQQQQNLEILKVMIPTLQKIMSDANIVWQDGWANIVSTIDTAQPQIISSIDFNAINRYLQDNIGVLTDEQRKAIAKLQEMYLNIGIPSEVVQYNRKVAIDLANSMSDALSKIGDGSRTALDNVTKYLMTSGQSVNDYAKTLDDALKDLKARIAELSAVGLLLSSEGRKKLEDLQTTAEFVEKLRGLISTAVTSKNRGSNRQSDPRLQTLQEMVQLAEKLNKEYQDWQKKVGSTEALEKLRNTYKDTVKYAEKLAKDNGITLPHLEVPTNAKELNEYLKVIQGLMDNKTIKGGKKAAIELGVKMSSNISTEEQQAIEKKIKTLADRISRTKTAKEFYDKILGMTGDVELAANISMQLYGSTGIGIDDMVKEQFQKAFEAIGNDHPELVAEINAIIDRGAYEELRDYISQLPADAQKAADDLVKAQQQMSAKQYEQWLKDLQKAQDFANKRIELSRYTANQIAAIEERIAKLNPQSADYASQKAMLEKIIADYRAREGKEATKIEYDMFKDMPLYVQMFDNLDNASTTMLNNMKRLLEQNKTKWGEFLDPTQLKEMQSRMNEIDKQLSARNPFKTLSTSLKSWWSLRKSGRNRKDDEQAAAYAIKAEADAMERWIAADKAYQAALKAHDNDTNNEEVKATKQTADKAEEKYKTAKKTSDAAQEQAAAWKEIADQIDNANQKIDEYQDQINKALDEVLDMMECFGIDAIDMEFFNSMKEGFNQILDGAQSAVQAFGQFATGNYFGAAMSSVGAITGIVSGISNLFTAGKVKRANKEIKRQQELLDQLEYSYNRLEKAAEKAFGGDYISNFRKQQKNLQAQAAAYQAQANAERSKGKKADKDKIKEYEEAYRETMDEIADMQGQIAAQMLGTDLTSAARDFAQAWLDAYKEFGNTADAMSEKFREMIGNMIVEGALSRVMEKALKPMFDMIDNMGEADFYSDAFWKQVVEQAEKGAEQADAGAQTMMKFLEQAGISMRDMSTDFTGIKREVAGATSEEMNANTAALNTQNYYMSHVPGMAANVAVIRQLMEGGTTANITTAAAGWTDWQQQAMDNYVAIQRNTADMVVECRRAAAACEEQVAQLRRVIVPRGSKGTHGVQVYM